MRRPALLIALLSCCALSHLAAQSTTATSIGLGGIDELLGRVESINIYYGGNLDRRPGESDGAPRLTWAKDYGLEFLVHLGEFGPPSSEQRRRNAERDRRRDRALDSLRIVRATRLEAARQAEYDRRMTELEERERAAMEREQAAQKVMEELTAPRGSGGTSEAK